MELLDTPNVIQSLKPNQKRAQWAYTLILLVVIFRILMTSMGLVAMQAYKDAQLGMLSASNNYQMLLICTSIFSMLYIACFLTSMVTFILWFRRAYYNISMKSNSLNDSPGAAAYSWFIPLLNLGRPFVMMKEMHNETSEILELNQVEVPFKLSITRVNLWWTLWIVCLVLGSLENNLAGDGDTIESYTLQLKWEVAILIFYIPLSILAIKMIRDYSKIEPLLKDVPDLHDAPAQTHAEI